MVSKYTGSCLCGTARYEIEGEFEQFYLCHCEHCRKDTGSAHAANLFSSSARLNWISGKDKTTMYNLPGTRHCRCFCSVCGSALPYAVGGMVVVPAGSLDSELHMRPSANIFMASKATWDRSLHEAPAFEHFPV